MKLDPEYALAVSRCGGDLIGAAIVYLQCADPTNPWACEEHTIRELRKRTVAALGELDARAMTLEDIRKDLILTCDFVKEMLTS